MADASFYTTAQIVNMCVTSGIAALLTVTVPIMARVIERRCAKSNHIWHYALIHALVAPIIFLIWVFLISFIMPTIVSGFDVTDDISKPLNIIRQIATVVGIFWFFMSYIGTYEKRFIEQITNGDSARNKTSIRAASLLARCAVVIIALLTLLGTFNISIGSILAFGGIGGAAIAFAAKDTIANFLGGMMIFWDRPFEVGDWISSPDRKYDGTVEDIGWRLTRIRTFDKRPMYIPNGIYSTIAVENPSRMTNRRIKTTIGVRYEDAPVLGTIVQESHDMLLNHPDIDTKQTCMVYFTEFGDSSLNFLVYTFTKTTDWSTYLSVQQDVFLKIIEIITRHGAECAFPSRTLYVPDPVNVARASGETV